MKQGIALTPPPDHHKESIGDELAVTVALMD